MPAKHSNIFKDLLYRLRPYALAAHPDPVPAMISDGIARADVELQRAVTAEREACAKVCDDKAMHCETKAQEAIEAGEYDEVSAIRSTAWQISVCAAAIRARGAA